MGENNVGDCIKKNFTFLPWRQRKITPWSSTANYLTLTCNYSQVSVEKSSFLCHNCEKNSIQDGSLNETRQRVCWQMETGVSYILGWHSTLCEHLALPCIRWLPAHNTTQAKTLPNGAGGQRENCKQDLRLKNKRIYVQGWSREKASVALYRSLGVIWILCLRADVALKCKSLIHCR